MFAFLILIGKWMGGFYYFDSMIVEEYFTYIHRLCASYKYLGIY